MSATGERADSRRQVGILFGGRSGEHEVSIQSGRGIFDALDASRFRAVPIGVERDGTWRLGDSRAVFVDADDVTRARIAPDVPAVVPLPGDGPTRLADATTRRVLTTIDVFFPILHGTFGEDGSIQGMLRMLGAPFVGPDVAASAIAMDKEISKRLFAQAGLPVARWRTVHRDEPAPAWDEIAADLGPCVFVKPANLGSSVGIRRVDAAAAWRDAVEEALRFDRRAIVEEAIEGREIECAVLGNENPDASLPGEIIPRHAFYTYEAKYVDPDGAKLCAPARLAADDTLRVRTLAVAAYRSLGCEGMARVDLFLRPEGSLVVNEINTLPGFTRISMYPRLWEVSGLPYPRLLERLIDLAEERHRRDAAVVRSYSQSR